MSAIRLFNKKHLKIVFQSSMIWALCIALFESFSTVTSTSVRYLGPWDVVIINVALFLVYVIIWFGVLMLASLALQIFWRKQNISAGNLSLFFLCVSLFLYRFFWIIYKAESIKLYHNMHGMFLSLTQIIATALIAFATYKIGGDLYKKGYLKQIGSKISAFGISAIVYMFLYIYLKSTTEQGSLHPLYSIALLIPFVIVFISFYYLIKKISPFFQRSNLSLATKVLTSLVVSLSLIFYFAYYCLSKNVDFHSGPNILFISIDTLRADHVSIYNEIQTKTTPNIDKIANGGYVFKRAYSPTSWTLPGHASMMTGLFPSSHQADRSLKQTMSRPVDPLPSSALTLAEILKDKGYLTAGIISNPFVSSAFGMNQGFDFYDDQVDFFEDVRYLALRDYSMLFKMSQIFKIIDKNDYDGERRVTEVNEKALAWLEKNRDKENPFFLFLHYNEPHFLYEPPWPYNKGDDGKPLEYFMDIERLNKGQFSLSTTGLRDLVTLYDGEISYLDHHLGLLFKKLDQWNLLDNIVIIITSDHGESFDEHEIWQHGNSLYEEQIRVPLIIHYPRLVPAGHVDSDHIVQLVDLLPTILDLVELPIPADIQGRSLIPIFKGESDLRFNLAFAEIRPDINWKAQNPRYGHGIKAVINKEWKFILNENGREELYKLDIDPHEKNNLVLKERVKSDEMRKILTLWSNAICRQKDRKNEKIDRGRLEQLRSLGYVK